MGWEVIALGSLTITVEDQIDQYHRLIEIKDQIDKSGYCIQAVIHDKDWIEIELSGNKEINYDFINKICDDLKHDKIKYELSLSEYSETGNTIYRNSEEEIGGEL